jgi:hypothetical protein
MSSRQGIIEDKLKTNPCTNKCLQYIFQRQFEGKTLLFVMDSIIYKIYVQTIIETGVVLQTYIFAGKIENNM